MLPTNTVRSRRSLRWAGDSFSCSKHASCLNFQRFGAIQVWTEGVGLRCISPWSMRDDSNENRPVLCNQTEPFVLVFHYMTTFVLVFHNMTMHTSGASAAVASVEADVFGPWPAPVGCKLAAGSVCPPVLFLGVLSAANDCRGGAGLAAFATAMAAGFDAALESVTWQLIAAGCDCFSPLGFRAKPVDRCGASFSANSSGITAFSDAIAELGTLPV